MNTHLEREIGKLKSVVIDLGRFVENQVRLSMCALIENDLEAARSVVKGDDEVDQREVDLEEECLKILALYQPVASDLRFVVSVLKMNNDLERIGDLAVNIAVRAIRLDELGYRTVPEDFLDIAKKTKLMLRQALLSLVETDTKIAMDVLNADDAVDALLKKIYEKTITDIKQDSSLAEEQIILLAVAKRLERVADLSSNIAEDVIYMMDGNIVRHGHHQAQAWRE
jgi:phosphate transport system protein